MAVRVALRLPVRALHGETEVGYARRQVVGEQYVGALEVAVHDRRLDELVPVAPDRLRVQVGEAAQSAVRHVLHRRRCQRVRLTTSTRRRGHAP